MPIHNVAILALTPNRNGVMVVKVSTWLKRKKSNQTYAYLLFGGRKRAKSPLDAALKIMAEWNFSGEKLREVTGIHWRDVKCAQTATAQLLRCHLFVGENCVLTRVEGISPDVIDIGAWRVLAQEGLQVGEPVVVSSMAKVFGFSQ